MGTEYKLNFEQTAPRLNYMLNITNRYKEDATNSNYYRKDLEKTDYNDKGFSEGTLLDKIHGKKEDAQREILNDHTYRKILGKESYNYQQYVVFNSN